MFFTQEDYNKIYNWIKLHSIKDSEFNDSKPLDGMETITVVQQGHNVKFILQDFLEQLTLLNIPDFVNVTERYNLKYISLFEAIKAIPYRSRKIGQVVTFLDEDGNWKIHQFRGEKRNQWNILTLWVDILQDIIDKGNILPDEEDLTAVKEGDKTVVKFKDKAYNPDNFSGKGRVYLRKNITQVEDPTTFATKTVNLLTQSMIGKENTIYIIQYDYDLNGQTITIPEGCILQFEGGSFNNGSIISKFIRTTAFSFDNVSIHGIVYVNGVECDIEGNPIKRTINLKSPIASYYDINYTSNQISIARDLSINKFQLQVGNGTTVSNLQELFNKEAPFIDTIKFHVDITNDNMNFYTEIIDYIIENNSEVRYVTISNENSSYVSNKDTALILLNFCNKIKDKYPSVKVGVSMNYSPNNIDAALFNALDFLGYNKYPSLPLVDYNDAQATNITGVEFSPLLRRNGKPGIITECGILPLIEARAKPVMWNISSSIETTPDSEGLYTELYYRTVYKEYIKEGVDDFCIWYVEQYTKDNIGTIGINRLHELFIAI